MALGVFYLTLALVALMSTHFWLMTDVIITKINSVSFQVSTRIKQTSVGPTH